MGQSIYAGLGTAQRNALTLSCCMVKYLSAIGHNTARAMRAESVRRKLMGAKAQPLRSYISLHSRQCECWEANRARLDEHMLRRRDQQDGVQGLCANDCGRAECNCKAAGVTGDKELRDAAEKAPGICE